MGGLLCAGHYAKCIAHTFIWISYNSTTRAPRNHVTYSWFYGWSFIYLSLLGYPQTQFESLDKCDLLKDMSLESGRPEFKSKLQPLPG